MFKNYEASTFLLGIYPHRTSGRYFNHRLLAALALPAINGALKQAQLTGTMSNARQLYMATQQMALDGSTTGDSTLCWPGDGSQGTWAEWANSLVPSDGSTGGYLNQAEFNKLISAPGVLVSATATPSSPGKSALIVYKVTEQSPGDTVFITTQNFDYSSGSGQQPTDSAKPFGTAGFVVFRKAGDGVILKSRQYNQTNLIGSHVEKVGGNPTAGNGK